MNNLKKEIVDDFSNHWYYGISARFPGLHNCVAINVAAIVKSDITGRIDHNSFYIIGELNEES